MKKVTLTNSFHGTECVVLVHDGVAATGSEHEAYNWLQEQAAMSYYTADNRNARLIAAAPELLAALELALTTLSSVACNESDEIDNVKTEIANAINKAKGE